MLAMVFVAEFVLGIFTLPVSFGLGVAFLSLSPVGVWFHGVGALRHLQEWLEEREELAPVYGFRHPRAEELENDPEWTEEDAGC